MLPRPLWSDRREDRPDERLLLWLLRAERALLRLELPRERTERFELRLELPRERTERFEPRLELPRERTEREELRPRYRLLRSRRSMRCRFHCWRRSSYRWRRRRSMTRSRSGEGASRSAGMRCVRRWMVGRSDEVRGVKTLRRASSVPPLRLLLRPLRLRALRPLLRLLLPRVVVAPERPTRPRCRVVRDVERPVRAVRRSVDRSARPRDWLPRA